MISRTFRYRVSWLNWAATMLTACAAMMFFWHRSAACALVGLALMVAGVLMVERMIHTSYMFTSAGLLVIDRGRFSRTLRIPVSEILDARVVRGRFLPVRYVLIEYGVGRFASVQPVGEESFISEIRRRQELIDI